MPGRGVKRDNHRYRGFFCQQWQGDRGASAAKAACNFDLHGGRRGTVAPASLGTRDFGSDHGAQPQGARQAKGAHKCIGLLVPALSNQRTAIAPRDRSPDRRASDRYQFGDDRKGLLPIHPVGHEVQVEGGPISEVEPDPGPAGTLGAGQQKWHSRFIRVALGTQRRNRRDPRGRPSRRQPGVSGRGRQNRALTAREPEGFA